MIMNRDATTTGCHTDAVADAADLNVWTSELGEMSHNDKHAGISKERTRRTSIRTDSPVTVLSWEKLGSLNQMGIKSVAKIAQREELRSMSRNLVEETPAKSSLLATVQPPKTLKHVSFSFMETVIMNVIHCRVLHESLSQSLNRWSRYGTFV